MSELRAQLPAGTEALRPRWPGLLASSFVREKRPGQALTMYASPRKTRAQSSVVQFLCLHNRISAQPLKSSFAASSSQSAPAQCQPPTSPLSPAPPPPPSVSGPESSQAATPVAPIHDAIDLNDIYSRLLLDGGLRVAGAMAVAAVPVFLLFKRPSMRTFLVGSVGGFVCGWQSHKADILLRDPRENTALIPKAASFAECAEQLQREWKTAAKRIGSFSWK